MTKVEKGTVFIVMIPHIDFSEHVEGPHMI